MSKNVDKLVKRLKTELDLDVIPETFRRTRASSELLAAGSFSWTIDLNNQVHKSIGGFDPLSKYIIKKNRIEKSNYLGTIAIDVYPPSKVNSSSIKNNKSKESE